jgi:sugar phosphate isomerase/epimerase
MTPYTRRDFTKLALLAAGTPLLPSLSAATAAAAKPNSKVNGVSIGLNVPYSFGNNALSYDEVLNNCVSLGVSALELRAQPIEGFLGVPADLVATRRANTGDKSGPVDPAAAQAKAEELRKWRTAVPMSKVAEFRKLYEGAGVAVEILKVDGIDRLSDDVLDYYFAMAKAVGARAISCEIPSRESEQKRVGQFADKHKLMVGYHGHASTGPAAWEKAFALAAHNGANVDLGHYVAGKHELPVIEFMKRHHARITHVHVKDRKKDGANLPFGTGETPIVEALRLIRDQRWPIQATIEFEYRVPEGSTRMAEIAKAIQYCRDALA